ncbi:MAG: type I-A CRISPR-associated protein Cas5a [Thermoproteota archaeon]
MKILGVHVFAPLYTIRDPASWGVRMSFLLPPPRTLIGALARGLGITYGIASGEERLKGEFTRNILCYALEKSIFATIRPLSPLVKTSQIIRMVPAVEKGESIETPEKAHDAFKTDFIFCGNLKIVYAIDIDMVNSVFEKYDLPKTDTIRLNRAARFLDRIGQTESICYVKNIELLEIKGESTNINTYLPTYWIKDITGNYFIRELLPNIRIIENYMKKRLGIESIEDKDLRKKKIPFLLPLQATGYHRGREFLEPAEVTVQLKLGYKAYLLNDGTKIALPS